MCGLYLASSNNPRKMSSYTLTPNAYLMQESIQTLRFIRSEMIWIQIILIEMQIRRDMKRERYWLKFTNWHKLCHIVDSVPFFTSVRNSVFKCWIRSTAIPSVLDNVSDVDTYCWGHILRQERFWIHFVLNVRKSPNRNHSRCLFGLFRYIHSKGWRGAGRCPMQ